MWQKSSLLASLEAFDWSLTDPLVDSTWQAYLDHYQLPSTGHYAGLLTIGEQQICLQAWQPQAPQGTVLIVHGLYDHVGLFNHLIAYCLEQNLRVLAADLPGHGLSSGAPTAIASFQDYDQVVSRLITNLSLHFATAPLHLIGQSLGGAICLNYLLKNRIHAANTPFQSVNLLAPLVRPRGYFKARLLYPLLRFVLTRLGRGRSRNSHDQAFLDWVLTDSLTSRHLDLSWIGAMLNWITFIESQPSSDLALQVIQGEEDHTVAWRYNWNVIQQKFPYAQRTLLPQARHHLVKESEEFRQQAFAALKWV